MKVAAAARPGLRRLPIVPVRDLSVGRSELVDAGRLEAEEEDPNVGFYHSYEITGAVNGPGIRFTLFVNGCPLRCQFCHNPDTWMMRNGRRVTADRMMAEIAKYERVAQGRSRRADDHRRRADAPDQVHSARSSAEPNTTSACTPAWTPPGSSATGHRRSTSTTSTWSCSTSSPGTRPRSGWSPRWTSSPRCGSPVGCPTAATTCGSGSCWCRA